MQQLVTIAVLFFLTAAAAAENSDDGVYIPGDIILGGLFPITSGEDCASITSDRGIQRMEAMIFSLAKANSNSQLLMYGRHKITVGGRLFDTCSSSHKALRKSLTFLNGKGWNSDQPQGSGYYACIEGNGTLVPAIPVRSIVNSSSGTTIQGIVGAAYSQVTYSVTRLLELFDIPVISYASTSSALSSKPLFARTVAADSVQGKILADIVAQFKKWNFVSVVFSRGDYSESVVMTFEQELAKRGVCIDERSLVPMEPTSEELDRIVSRLTSGRARAVALLLHWSHIKPFTDAVNRANLSSGRIAWLASDSWGSYEIAEIARGAITIEMDAPELPLFADYFASMRPKQPRVLSSFKSASGEPRAVFFNPYFDQFWQQKFRCSLDDTNGSGEAAEERRPTLCSSSLRIDQESLKLDKKCQFVSDAVNTFVRALDKVMKLVCSTQNPESDTKINGTFDECVKNITKFSGLDLYKIMVSKNNAFVNQAGRTVEFDASGDRMPSFTVWNYRYNSSTAEHKYVPIGTWRSGTGLNLTAQDIIWPDGGNEAPKSICSEECGPGQKMLFSNRGSRLVDRCCWTCAEI